MILTVTPITTRHKKAERIDCDGVWGYAELLEALKEREHPEHEEMGEWLGGEFDPRL